MEAPGLGFGDDSASPIARLGAPIVVSLRWRLLRRRRTWVAVWIVPRK